MKLWGLLRLFLAAAAVGTLFELLGVPAGMLLGAVIGAALVNQRWTPRMKPAEVPAPLRQGGLVLMGFVTGVLLTLDSLASTATIAIPVAVAYLLLGVVNLGFVTLLMSRYGVDPATAVFAVTPGGLGEVMSLAMDRGAEVVVVLTVHAVRLFTLVLVLLPIMLWVLAE
ncbi:ammonia monooxygenase [Nesterenkonia sp. MY13]|uniref:Ammonia monooxygenase n=1 Tax=Nesterenkonia sedimenti TaxID=1463632 RepID=A0A7X8TIT3_9MICC|nr:AbrB family transcriptional regulator [Nesterenkonia sedimenti]NLS09331.1 ammonia monooxygenase [Nesterenkonia sedimenti]